MGSLAEQQNGHRHRVPIPELQPALDSFYTSITGIVTLIWPYSSSRKTLSLLLAEPDFRLRHHRGQVRVHFTGSSATAVARSGVSIGTQVNLRLVGVQWAKDESTPRTPGKGVEWELQFGERMFLQIERELEEPIMLDIDHPILSPTPQTFSPTPPRTPSSSSIFAFPRSHLGIGENPETWSSPAFLKRSRLSSNYSNLQYDPFRDDDFEEEKKRRKRTKFGRESGQWRFSDRTPSPAKDFQAADPPADEQVAVATGGEVEVSAAMSPESPESVQERPKEAIQIEETRDGSPYPFIEKADEDITLVAGVEDAVEEIPQVSPEAQFELEPGTSSAHEGEPEEELSHTAGDYAGGDKPEATLEAEIEPAPICSSLDAGDFEQELVDAVEGAARATPEAQLETVVVPFSPYEGELRMESPDADGSRSLIEEEKVFHEHLQEASSSSDEDEIEPELEAELAGAQGSGSSIGGATECQEDLKRAANSLGEEEHMVLDRLEDQQISRASRSPLISEASVIVIGESSSGEEDEADLPAVMVPRQESLDSAGSGEVLSLRGSSAEPAASDEDQSELDMDEDFDVSDFDLPVNFNGGLEPAIEGDSMDSEPEDGVVRDDGTNQEPVLERSENYPILPGDAERMNNSSEFGLDGSSFSRFRSGSSHIYVSNETVGPVQILPGSAVQIEDGKEIVPLFDTREEGAEPAVVKDVDIHGTHPLGTEISPADEVVEGSMEHHVEQDVAESEGLDASNDMEYIATSLDQSQRQVFDVKLRSHEGTDIGAFDDEPSNQDAVQTPAQKLANNVPIPPHVVNVEATPEELHSDEKKDLADAEEDFSRQVVDQGEVMDTSPDVPPRTSTVEIIDLESEDEEVHASEDNQLEAGLDPTLQELKPMITILSDQISSDEEEEEEDEEDEEEADKEDEEGSKLGDLQIRANKTSPLNNLACVEEEDYAQGVVHLPVRTELTLQDLDPVIEGNTDHQASSIKDEGNDISGLLKAQADDVHPLEGSHAADIETAEPHGQFNGGEELFMSTVTTLQHSGTANDDQTAIDPGIIMPKVEDEVLHSSDNEFPDILDLFAASRKSKTADEAAAVVSQTSIQKTIYAQPLPDVVKSKRRAPAKAEMDVEVKEVAEEETLPAKEMKLQTQLLTPNATQKTQLLSQESSVSPRSLYGDKSLPTPRLTQAVATPTLDSTIPKRRSFVERLREMRSLSANSLKIRKSTDAVSPWFTPNTSGKIIPNTDSDSVDSQDLKHQTSSDDDDHPKTKPSPTAVRQSPRLHRTVPSTPSPTDHQSTQTQQPGFRTTLSYFAPLSTLSSHYDTPIDVLATIIGSSTITRAKSGPKDFHQSLYITDPSCASSESPITARIFRPHETAFPEVSMGDAILLRNFKVQSQAKRLMLLSTGSSAWAVFRKGEEVQMRGPPVEFAAEERGFVRGLWAWWDSLDLETRIPLMLHVREETRKGKTKEVEGGREGNPIPKKTRAAAKYTLREGTSYVDESAEEEYDYNTDDIGSRGTREKSTPAPRRTRAAARHELRDGTAYVDGTVEGDGDDDGRNKYKVKRNGGATASLSPRKTRAVARHELRDGATYVDGSAEDNDGNDKGSEDTTPKARRSTIPKARSSTKPKTTPTSRTTRSTTLHRPTHVDDPGEVEDSDHDKGNRSSHSTVTPGPQRSTTPSHHSTPRRTRATVRHELRDGTSYTDGKVGGKYGTHELRDGTKWRDGEDE